MLVPRSILLAALVAVAACSDDNGGSGPAPQGDITVENNEFEPGTLQVTPGTSVVWAWDEGATTHNVTFDDGPTSGNKSSGTYERTFAAAGTYPYHCTLHGTATSGMRGSVTVVATGGTGNGGGGNDGGGGGYDY